jgi:hypothetical protein
LNLAVVLATATSFLIGATAQAAAPAAATSTPAGAPAASSSAVATIDSAARERSRIEELFIWKASEELKLGAAEEAKFSAAVRSFNAKRRTANAKMDEALAQLAKAKTKAEADSALNAHRAALRGVQSVQTAELDQLRPLLGSQKLAQYLVVKNSILEKLKSVLSAPAPASTGPQSTSTPENSSSAK